jgi:hypothetical protein
VYGRLRLYGGADGKAYPRHETLAEVAIQPRQLRNVLGELQNAGWIDWKRTRTDASTRSFQIGKKLPVRSARNCRSDRQKIANPDRQKTAYRKEVLKIIVNEKT